MRAHLLPCGCSLDDVLRGSWSVLLVAEAQDVPGFRPDKQETPSPWQG
jgi:hypothetical protein